MTEQSNAKAILDFAKETILPVSLETTPDLDKPHLLTIPNGHHVEDLSGYYDKFRGAPRRLKGTAHFTDHQSFVQHVNRFKTSVGVATMPDAPDDEDAAIVETAISTIFATRKESEPKLTAVYDYNVQPGAPQFGEHRAVYDFPKSEEWLAWRGQDKKKMGQAEFAHFIEGRLADISILQRGGGDEKTPSEILADQMRLTIATPGELMELSRGLQVAIKGDVTNAVTLQSGESELHFKEEHTTKINVPGMFLIGIPVFEGGDSYQMAVLLRYRVSDGAVSWWFEIYRSDITFRAAFDDTVEFVAEQTSLPVWFGSPE